MDSRTFPTVIPLIGALSQQNFAPIRRKCPQLTEFPAELR